MPSPPRGGAGADSPPGEQALTWKDVQALTWKDAWWRHTLRSLHAVDGGSSNRLGRRHRCLGKRRWDDAIQATASERAEEHLQRTAQDTDVWNTLEADFIARVARVEPRIVHAIRVAATCSRTGTPTLSGPDCRFDLSAGIRNPDPVRHAFSRIRSDTANRRARGKHKIALAWNRALHKSPIGVGVGESQVSNSMM